VSTTPYPSKQGTKHPKPTTQIGNIPETVQPTPPTQYSTTACSRYRSLYKILLLQLILAPMGSRKSQVKTKSQPPRCKNAYFPQASRSVISRINVPWLSNCSRSSIPDCRCHCYSRYHSYPSYHSYASCHSYSS
jgi:hypothetical protein